MVKRLIAAAAVAAVAAVLWVLFTSATPAEPDGEISAEACLGNGFIDCVSFEAPAALTPEIAAPCRSWLTVDATPAMLSRCLHVMRDARGQAARRRQAVATSS